MAWFFILRWRRKITTVWKRFYWTANCRMICTGQPMSQKLPRLLRVPRGRQKRTSQSLWRRSGSVPSSLLTSCTRYVSSPAVRGCRLRMWSMPPLRKPSRAMNASTESLKVKSGEKLAIFFEITVSCLLKRSKTKDAFFYFGLWHSSMLSILI